MKLLPREEELKKVFRYVWSPCDPMFYRPELLIHSNRVEWIATRIAKTLNGFENKVNVDLVKELARFHDDTEIITWDYLAMDKEKFSKEKQSDYENDSQRAINILCENYKNISNNFDYRNILQILEEKEWLEFFIVDFADKLDAHLEICHELFAWNKAFTIILEKWNLDVDPFDYTKNKLKKILPKIISNFEWNFDLKNTFLDLEWDFDANYCLDKVRTHTLETLKKPTLYHLYDLWVDLHFEEKNKKFLDYLLNRLEW